jgi:hypothetical protein
MDKRYCGTVAEYVEAIGPHDQHQTYRCDDPPARMLGRGCRDHGVEVYIRISDFKGTGDMPEYDKLMEAKYPAPKKK